MMTDTQNTADDFPCRRRMPYALYLTGIAHTLPEAPLDEALQALSAHLCPLEAATVYEATLNVCDDAEIRGYNQQFRGMDKPTNVLSFPDGSTFDNTCYLGDIALSAETLRREAQEQEKSLEAHLCHLIIHSFLHLMGFDHETDEEAALMEDAETRLLGTLHYPDPYNNETMHHE